MAEMLMDGLGSGNLAIVDDSHRLWTNISGIIGVSGMVNDWTLNLKQLMDYQGTYQPVYIGLALPGTGSETAGWFIRKNIYENDLNVAVLFASGNTNFDKTWSLRSGIYEAYS